MEGSTIMEQAIDNPYMGVPSAGLNRFLFYGDAN